MRLRLTVRGAIQGVGFRPWVARLAQKLSLVGWVSNAADCVEIEAQGPKPALSDFLKQLNTAPSPIQVLDLQRVQISDRQEQHFRILDSRRHKAGHQVLPLIPDAALCDECKAELLASDNRRHRYPFITCAQCGPRYSILRELPFDRERTSMGNFTQCEACLAEYQNPTDRRFHAQTISCPNCGPQLQFQRASVTSDVTTQVCAVDDALNVLRQGGILALLGIGGMQLLTDATNDAAVAQLRARKRRPDKPFALLCSETTCQRYFNPSPAEWHVMRSQHNPILLLEHPGKADRAPHEDLNVAAPTRLLSPLVAPGSPRLGVMLPSSGLHLLLAQDFGAPLICTSGNRRSEPIITDPVEAIATLKDVADAFLLHDRQVVTGIDDSVAQLVNGQVQVLRRARGYVPAQPLVATSRPSQSGGYPARTPAATLADVPRKQQVVLGLGAQQKSTLTLLFEAEGAVTGPHLGDLNTESSISQFRKSVDQWLRLHDAEPTVIVCDKHPDYVSSQLARALSQQYGARLVEVQHHHAHVAACSVEHHLKGLVTGFAWDGVGAGDDAKSLWGGEILRCEGPRFERRYSLEPFPLPGGEQAMREPRRSALGLLFSAKEPLPSSCRQLFTPTELPFLGQMLERQVNCPKTSSMGRLFDAAAALAGLRGTCSYEGQAAMEWMGLAERAAKSVGAYKLELEGSRILWRGLICAMLSDLRKATPIEVMARRFHEALVNLILEIADIESNTQLALCGGCFQNSLLAERALTELKARGRHAALPLQFPPNDASISLGQAYLGLLSVTN